jgi:hypothetical protein
MTGAKPQDSFQDRASALLMAGRGWLGEFLQSAAASKKRKINLC